MYFTVEKKKLPHEGIIPGARGHKKQIIPTGTEVFVVLYGTRKYWAAYLDEDTAKTVAKNLDDYARGKARRSIPLDTLVQFNFSWEFPVRICRPK